MDIIRKSFDALYDVIKPIIFAVTKDDSEKAHDLFVLFCKMVHKAGLERIIFDYSRNNESDCFEFSNAAGFNKNAEISPSLLYYFGFNRGVIGTVTKEFRIGNRRPRCIRYEQSASIVNWMGLPCDGAEKIAERIAGYKYFPIPLTLNFAATPEKYGDEMIQDLLDTLCLMRSIQYIDRFELNISCPNAVGSCLSDVRDVEEILSAIYNETWGRALYLKLSPDVIKEDAEEIVLIAQRYNIAGFTISNTTKRHLKKYVPDQLEAGGASGDAVYQYSLDAQRLFEDVIRKSNYPQKVIACGGINSVKRVKERLSDITKGIQIYTPIVFSGTKIIKTLA